MTRRQRDRRDYGDDSTRSLKNSEHRIPPRTDRLYGGVARVLAALKKSNTSSKSKRREWSRASGLAALSGVVTRNYFRLEPQREAHMDYSPVVAKRRAIAVRRKPLSGVTRRRESWGVAES